ncbi:unnamed protein product [Amoebophrya sp. A25]|nr:unnamed protein product [Amoebophrya sp. A25]|eukprot:GSA25T00019641001.1
MAISGAAPAASSPGAGYGPPVELPSSNAQNFFEEAKVGHTEQAELKRKFLRFSEPRGKCSLLQQNDCARTGGADATSTKKPEEHEQEEDEMVLRLHGFCRLLQHYEVCPAHHFEAYFHAMDRTRDDVIDFKEFFLGCCAADPQTVHILNSFTGFERSKYIFDFYDTNRSGNLEFLEFSRLLGDTVAVAGGREQTRKHAIEKGRELKLLREGNGRLDFTAVKFKNFYEYIHKEQLRGTSRLFRFHKGILKPRRRSERVDVCAELPPLNLPAKLRDLSLASTAPGSDTATASSGGAPRIEIDSPTRRTIEIEAIREYEAWAPQLLQLDDDIDDIIEIEKKEGRDIYFLGQKISGDSRPSSSSSMSMLLASSNTGKKSKMHTLSSSSASKDGTTSAGETTTTASSACPTTDEESQRRENGDHDGATSGPVGNFRCDKDNRLRMAPPYPADGVLPVGSFRPSRQDALQATAAGGGADSRAQQVAAQVVRSIFLKKARQEPGLLHATSGGSASGDLSNQNSSGGASVSTKPVVDAPPALTTFTVPFSLVSPAQLEELLNAVSRILLAESVVVKPVHSLPTKVFGSLHGQLVDLLTFFQSFGFPHLGLELGDLSYTHYVFLGDYVDRGAQSLELLTLLFALKLQAPERVTLLRGHHENRHVNAHLGFRQECEARLPPGDGARLYDVINRAFELMPLACQFRSGFLCLPNGLPRLLDHELREHRTSAAGLRSLTHLESLMGTKPVIVPHPQALNSGNGLSESELFLVRYFYPHLSEVSGSSEKSDPTKEFLRDSGLCAVITSRRIPESGVALAPRSIKAEDGREIQTDHSSSGGDRQEEKQDFSRLKEISLVSCADVGGLTRNRAAMLQIVCESKNTHRVRIRRVASGPSSAAWRLFVELCCGGSAALGVSENAEGEEKNGVSRTATSHKDKEMRHLVCAVPETCARFSRWPAQPMALTPRRVVVPMSAEHQHKTRAYSSSEDKLCVELLYPIDGSAPFTRPDEQKSAVVMALDTADRVDIASLNPLLLPTPSAGSSATRTTCAVSSGPTERTASEQTTAGGSSGVNSKSTASARSSSRAAGATGEAAQQQHARRISAPTAANQVASPGLQRTNSTGMSRGAGAGVGSFQPRPRVSGAGATSTVGTTTNNASSGSVVQGGQQLREHALQQLAKITKEARSCRGVRSSELRERKQRLAPILWHAWLQASLNALQWEKALSMFDSLASHHGGSSLSVSEHAVAHWLTQKTQRNTSLGATAAARSGTLARWVRGFLVFHNSTERASNSQITAADFLWGIVAGSGSVSLSQGLAERFSNYAVVARAAVVLQLCTDEGARDWDDVGGLLQHSASSGSRRADALDAIFRFSAFI